MLALGHLGTHPVIAWLCLDAVSQHMLREATERGRCPRRDDRGSQLSGKLHTGNSMEQPPRS